MTFKAAKLRLYKTIVTLVVVNASELWMVTKQLEDKLEVRYEKCWWGDEKWRRRTNTETLHRILRKSSKSKVALETFGGCRCIDKRGGKDWWKEEKGTPKKEMLG